MRRFIAAAAVIVRRAFRTVLAVVLSFSVLSISLLAGGCSRQDAELNDAISTVSSSGIGVYDSYSTPALVHPIQGSPSAMKFTRWQLANLIAAAHAGSGLTGAEMDRIGGKLPKNAPSFSYFLAGWLVAGKSDLALYARSLMPKRANYKQAPKIIFPLLVTMLFIGDIARVPAGVPSAPKTSFQLEQLIAAPAEASGVCSTVTNFIESIIAGVVNALQVKGDSTVVFLWNTLVEVIVGVTVAVIKALIAPVLKIITAIAAVVSIVAMVASTLQGWSLTLKPDQDVVQLGDQSEDHTFTATLDAPSLPFPPDVIDCGIALGGIDLSTVNYKNAPVVWQTAHGEVPSLTDVVDKDTATTIRDDKTARLTYRTRAVGNLPKPECSVEQLVGSIGATATVAREDVLKLEKELTKAVAAQLPTLIRPLILDLIAPWLESAQKSFQNLVAKPVTASNFVQLSEPSPDPHPDPKKCPSPSPASTSSGTPPQPNPSSSSGFDPSSFVGSWACEVHVTVQNKELGAFSVTVHANYGFTPGGGVSGGSSADAQRTGPKSISAGNQKVTTGSDSYHYKPTSATTGILRFDQKDQTVHWVNANQWNADELSSISGRHYSMVCTRS
ncbi:MAG TPA: hypothetical protein VMS32_10290 [Verrucomicrobiae bacterium]|nr:hypothetical protein [Verrucomicrobiae bacterium]